MKRAYLLAGGAILMWSTMATVSKLLLGTMSQYQVLAVSALFASVLLLVFNGFTGRLAKLKAYRLKDYFFLILSGLPGTFLYYVFYYSGARILPASQAFIVNYLWPIMSILFACILLKEKLTVRKSVAIFLSFLGVLTVAGNDLLHMQSQTLLGMGLCAAGAVSYGFFTAVVRKRNYDQQITLMFAYFFTALLGFCMSFTAPTDWSLGIPQILGLGWNGIICMAGGSTLWMLALSAGDTAKISNLAYITPFLSLVWIFFFLQEIPSPLSVIGLCIIVLGIFIQLRDKK